MTRQTLRFVLGVLVGAILAGAVAAFAQGGVTTVDIVNAVTGYRVTGSATSGRYLRGNGTNMVLSSVAAPGAGSCTNQFVRATVDNAAPTCAAVDDASLASNYSGTGGCTNQFPRTLNDNAAPTCADVAAADFANQTANMVLAGPSSGGAADPTFRAIVDADIPAVVARDTEVPVTFAGFVSTVTEDRDFAGWIPLKAVTMKKLSVVWDSAGTGGSTGVRLSLSDGTTTITCDVACTVAAGVTTGCDIADTNYAANAVLEIRITAATDCTLNPAGVNVVAEGSLQ